jgi:hypothetical protein
MLSITYISSATALLSEQDLVRMLTKIRPLNQQQGITGMMLYRDGNIIQTIEGPDDVVMNVFKKIEADVRHKDVMVLLKESVERRQFPEWSMGFHNVSKIPEEALEGFSAFLRDPVAAKAFRDNPEPAFQLLTMFRENMH